jgi:aminoglycoside phosphotransferase
MDEEKERACEPTNGGARLAGGRLYEGVFRLEAGTRGAAHNSRARLYPAASLDHARRLLRWARTALGFPFSQIPNHAVERGANAIARAFGTMFQIAKIAIWPRSFHPSRASELNGRRTVDDIPQHIV